MGMRSAGQSITTPINLMFSFVIRQVRTRFWWQICGMSEAMFSGVTGSWGGASFGAGSRVVLRGP